jgi:hypothetical protein
MQARKRFMEFGSHVLNMTSNAVSWLWELRCHLQRGDPLPDLKKRARVDENTGAMQKKRQRMHVKENVGTLSFTLLSGRTCC